MRAFRVGFVLLLPFAAAAQQAALKGPVVADMNRNVEACSDFYEFANGGWRAANPIPAEMPRWSRRWQAGEASKDRLKEILEEAASVQNAPKGSGVPNARGRPGTRQNRRENCSSVFVPRPYLRRAIASCCCAGSAGEIGMRRTMLAGSASTR